MAGIIDGTYNGTSDLPIHSFGSTYMMYWTNPGNGNGHYIRYDNLPWDVALEIDTKYDDGVYNTGTIRANEDYLAASSPVRYLFCHFDPTSIWKMTNRLPPALSVRRRLLFGQG